MARATRLFAMTALTFGVLALPVTSGAADSISMSFIANPFCGVSLVSCNIDAVKKGSLKLMETSKLGANGAKFKFVVSGATFAGAPVNLSSLKVVLNLIADGASCATYESPAFPIVEGKGKVLFDAATLTPPIAEGAIAALPCDFAFLLDESNMSVPALGAIRFGTDAD